MANHKSALKRIEQTEVRSERNRAHTSKLRHQIRKLRMALDSKDKATAQALLQPTLAMLDHSVSKGILHANTAARTKSRLAVRLSSLG